MTSPVGITVFTKQGIEKLQQAAVDGTRIKPVKFKVSDRDIDLYNGIDASEFISVWYTGTISGYRKVDKNTAEFICEIPPNLATKTGAVFALLTEDGTIIALAKPPFPFPPLLRQRIRIQLVWQNLEQIVDFKYLPGEEYERHLLDWNTFEYIASINRLIFSSGVITTPYNHTHHPLNDPAENSYTAEGSWTALGIHNHPNYRAMPGMGQLWVNVNGYILQTRHNDYRLFKKGQGFLNTVENPSPTAPQISIADMKDLFYRYTQGQLSSSEKQYFRWDLAYLEAFILEVESIEDIPSDLFSSFRHAIPHESIKNLNEKAINPVAEGYKNRFENYPYFATFALPNGKIGVLVYRILSHPLPAEFNGLRWFEFLEVWDAFDIREAPLDSPSKRFRFRKDVVDINQIIERIPGLEGEGAQITEWKTPDGYPIVGVNFAYYHRRYNLAPDAVNLTAWSTGVNDPNLFVAHTTRAEVYRGTSYLIPLEVILRIPLETWNPYGIPTVETINGNGLSRNTAYNGRNERGFWYFTPAELFSTERVGTVADTGTSPKWVKDQNGAPHLCYGSGIWITLPAFDFGKVRLRFPIAPDATEMGLWGHIADRVAKQLSAVLGRKLLYLEHEVQKLKGGLKYG